MVYNQAAGNEMKCFEIRGQTLKVSFVCPWAYN
jgi:hypothetical protein